MMVTADVRYPIGGFDWNAHWSPASRLAALRDIADVPRNIRRAVGDLQDTRLDTSYRPGGWTVRQVVHHLADSSIHGYIRLKFALAEDNPTIVPYDQGAWAELPDSRLPLGPSLALLDAVNEHWGALCRTLGDRDLQRVYTHPALGRLTVEVHLHFFAWHFRHHIAHITTLRDREGW